MSCGTRVWYVLPGDPDGVGLLRSSLLINYSHTGTTNCWCRELLMAAPDHRGPPGAAVSPVAVLQTPWLRHSTTAPSCALQLPYCDLAVHICRALLDLGYERNLNHIGTQSLL